MATAEVDSRPQGGNQQEKGGNSKKTNGSAKHKKNNTWGKSTNPYPQSGHVQEPQASQPSIGNSSNQQYNRSSYSSLPVSATQDRDEPSQSNKSGAPTLATNSETVHSDGGNSRAATTTTGAGGLSSVDGAGGGSTFSSPNHSDHSLATTLTTIQSTSMTPGAHGISGHHTSHNDQTQPMGSSFSHQYPVSPSMQTTATPVSAIPRHLHGDTNQPNTYNSATTGNLLTDNASILTLASSSKRRRRSMDTDASVRALAPSSVFGGSRESLPLSVLSSNIDPPRHSVTGPTSASAERASVYSSSGLIKENIGSPALASERNSYYKQGGDAKSLRSISNLKKENTASADTASITGIYPRSEYDARSLNAGDVASIRSVEGTGGHGRNGSIGGSIAPSLLRHTSTGGNTALSLSRRNSDWKAENEEDETAVESSFVEGEDGKKHD